MAHKIYIAGPDVFLGNADDVLQEKVKACERYGAIGLSPIDNETTGGTDEYHSMSKKIFRGNMELIHECDIIIANCNPFRESPLVDDGTAFELACGYMLDKRLYCYMDDTSTTEEKLMMVGGYERKDGVFDREGYRAEPFGNPMNLMLTEAVRENGAIIEGGFEDVLKYLSDEGILRRDV